MKEVYCKVNESPKDNVLDNTSTNDIINILQEKFPNGHPGFMPLLVKTGELHSKKNYGYAKDGNPLGNFYRVSKIKEIYPGFDWTTPLGTCIDYLFKQFDAAMWQLAKGYEDKGEPPEVRFKDVFVYTGIAILILEDMKKNNEKSTT